MNFISTPITNNGTRENWKQAADTDDSRRQVYAYYVGMMRAGQHMSVVCVYFAKSVLSGASQMKGVYSAQKRCGRQGIYDFARGANKRMADRKPFPDAIKFVLLEILQNILRFLRIDVAFSKMPMQNRIEFDASDFARSQPVSLVSCLPHDVCEWFIEIAFGDVSGVEIDQLQPLISET
jgi:hypothetical protein